VSDAELARRINSSRQTVNNWINGRRDINIRWLHKVADALEVRVRDLFDE
jgi:DNA-binding XRE family transcriptional regulator